MVPNLKFAHTHRWRTVPCSWLVLSSSSVNEGTKQASKQATRRSIAIATETASWSNSISLSDPVTFCQSSIKTPISLHSAISLRLDFIERTITAASDSPKDKQQSKMQTFHKIALLFACVALCASQNQAQEVPDKAVCEADVDDCVSSK